MTTRVYDSGVLVGETENPQDLIDKAAAANRRTIEDKALAALIANANDLTQDDNVATQAQAIVDNPATNLTTTQIVGVLKDLARGLVVMANNDANAKRELNALIRLVLGEFDSTDGT